MEDNYLEKHAEAIVLFEIEWTRDLEQQFNNLQDEDNK